MRSSHSELGLPVVVLELDFGLLAFRAGSPLAGVSGCGASKTAFTKVNLVNL